MFDTDPEKTSEKHQTLKFMRLDLKIMLVAGFKEGSAIATLRRPTKRFDWMRRKTASVLPYAPDRDSLRRNWVPVY
jgi:hypothetical protein